MRNLNYYHMNLKDTMILLIFLLAIVGLIVGIYYSEDVSSESSHHSSHKRIYEEENGVLTVTLEKNNDNDYNRFLT